MDNVSGDESFQGIQMVERVVYVIGMRQTGKKYPQIKYGKIYKTETHLYSSDNIVYGEGHGGWVLRYPLRDIPCPGNDLKLYWLKLKRDLN